MTRKTQHPEQAHNELTAEQSEKIKVTFITNTKHNKTLYQAGQKAEVTKDDYDVLLAAGVIRTNEE